MSNILENVVVSIHMLNIFVGIPLFIFGVIGNISLLYIFSRSRFLKVSSIRYLFAASITSLIQLMQTLLPRILTEGFGIPLVKSNSNYCKAHNYIASVVTLCSIFYPCWTSFDQYVNTSRNAATRKQWTSKWFVNSAIFGTLLFWLIIQLPNVIFSYAIDESCLSRSIISTYIYSYAVTPLTYSIVPTIAISYFSIGIARNLRQSRIVSIIQVNKYLARQIRRTLIPQLILLLVSGIPYSLQTIYTVATLSIKKDPLRAAVENLAVTIVRFLFYLNYVGSFYIYILMSSKIRCELKKIFFRQSPIYP
ncbi:unnamed protein product [Rotaria magnacalcarata]|uniref:G-protein coupled receptors family 1 profile domain-containing protein n=2 Tax=Rotaria magnacalcarata TaxID=392030 RepID=A0A816MDB5_9BILA|nr:unnamed protein product [Rotaria magnacalcarata]